MMMMRMARIQSNQRISALTPNHADTLPRLRLPLICWRPTFGLDVCSGSTLTLKSAAAAAAAAGQREVYEVM